MDKGTVKGHRCLLTAWTHLRLLHLSGASGSAGAVMSMLNGHALTPFYSSFAVRRAMHALPLGMQLTNNERGFNGKKR